jgi:hypothetical protein
VTGSFKPPVVLPPEKELQVLRYSLRISLGGPHMRFAVCVCHVHEFRGTRN